MGSVYKVRVGSLDYDISPAASGILSGFTSSDSTSPSAWTSVEAITTSESNSSIFSKLTSMVKNIRYLNLIMGSGFSTSSTVTSQLSGKAPTEHTHTKSQITDFPTSLPASDVYSWAKAVSKPSYTASEVGAAAESHTHAMSDITSGELSVDRGGTGLSASPSMLTNLSSTTAADILVASPRPGITGTLSVAHGGTGITSNPSMKVNLASTATADVFATSPRPGVDGVLPISNGGTGLSQNPSMITNLGTTSADNVLKASPRPGITGTLGTANGGTGITTNPSMTVNLASNSAVSVFQASPTPGVTGTLSAANGGTGATTLTPAVDSYAARAIKATDTDPTAGTTLTTGAILLVYE